ncbi:hypothetical protein VOLCADRAFT_109749 [Volvox carteri f. nagariensis]|uniref:m7GpppX diphosphatase n=1 Tax=Volvox carteri f. nagariensis TaxID=3068 RepID=D8TUN5_VOLCA|nr:uncharacterized protein VOLCADRAFT_109749 [Volvox carteri f. nagariensis]EFJ48855.1 hypothetical protein VOLCADRAFT_109749 [Volvox carteri f. nagariensis]|eukprot:XP_002950187.1 hypothetical protein VOLCADRAFT_109749 [Volvox carteri f. nagariensis]
MADTGAEAAKDGKLASFKDFTVTEVLFEDTMTKFIALLGRFQGREDPAVLLLSRKPFDKTDLSGLVGQGLALQRDFVNDIYSKYVGQPPAEHTTITVDLIYPATDKHIQKYRQQLRYMVRETPEVYERIVLPYIQSIPPARLQWVYNVLEKKKEVERLIFEDPDPQLGFMLHPDMKWDQKQVDQLYCLAIVHRRDVPCLRSLDISHLPLLENIRDRGSKAIWDKYGVPQNSLRIFVHYHPSYWHFHVHFIHAAMTAPGASAGKAILLDDVIDNLKTFGGDYWRKRTLTYQLGEADDLWRLLAGADTDI